MSEQYSVPTENEILKWLNDCAVATRNGEADHYWAFDVQTDDACDIVRAALEKWGKQQNVVPIPLGEGERLPGPDDLKNDKAWCGQEQPIGDQDTRDWCYTTPSYGEEREIIFDPLAPRQRQPSTDEDGGLGDDHPDLGGVMIKGYKVPTDWRALCAELISELADFRPLGNPEITALDRARAADRLSRRHSTPIPLSERKPVPEDCNELNLCWFWLPDINGHEDLGEWQLQDRGWATDPDTDYTHWQPFHAISRPS